LTDSASTWPVRSAAAAPRAEVATATWAGGVVSALRPL
jgi:hypothetical protein